MIDIALRNVLLNNATISGYTTSIYPLRLPQGSTGTRIVYNVMDGFSTAQVGSMSQNSETNIQLDIYSESYSTTRNLTTELITILNGAQGSFDTLEVSGIYVRNVMNTYEERLNLYRCSIDINVHVK